jgi:S1-C subfamily serine protease
MNSEIESKLELAQHSVLQISNAKQPPRTVGTCFVVHKDESAAYLVTCHHVVREAGGQDQLRIAGQKVHLIASGEDRQLDLAILKVDDLLDDRSPLSLSGIAHVNDQVHVLGLRPGSAVRGQRPLLRPLPATLGPAWVDRAESRASRDRLCILA